MTRMIYRIFLNQDKKDINHVAGKQGEDQGESYE